MTLRWGGKGEKETAEARNLFKEKKKKVVPTEQTERMEHWETVQEAENTKSVSACFTLHLHLPFGNESKSLFVMIAAVNALEMFNDFHIAILWE